MDPETATPPPAFSFPPVESTPNAMTEHQKHVEVSVLIILFALLGVFGLGFGTAYLVIKPTKIEKTAAVSATPTPYPTIASTPIPRDATFPKTMVFFRGQRLYRMDLITREEKEIVLEQNSRIIYSQPIIVDPNRVSFIRCERGATDPNTQTTCSIAVKALDTGVETDLIKRTSQVNSKGVHSGGTIRLYGWNPARTQLAFTAEEPMLLDGQANSKITVNLLTTATGAYGTIHTLDLGGGRGGSQDDDQGIFFSPDGSKFLLVDTALYPASPLADNGTMFVYDVYGNRLMWSQKAAWTTYGRWLDNQTVIAKQTQVAAQGATASASLMRLNIFSGAYQYLRSDVNNWYRVDVMPPSTVTFYSPKTPVGARNGVVLQAYDLTTNTVRMVKEQVLPFKPAGADYMVVQLTQPCNFSPGPEYNCEIDTFNGVLVHGLGILKASTGDVEALLSGGDNAAIYSLDTR